MILCKSCRRYTPETHTHGVCEKFGKVCGVIKACLEYRGRDK